MGADAPTTCEGQRLLDVWERSGGRLFVAGGLVGALGSTAGLAADLAIASLVAGAAAAGTASPAASATMPAARSWLVVLAVVLALRALATASSRQLAAHGARRVVTHIHGELLDRLLCPESPLSRPDRFGAGATAIAVLDDVDRLAPYFARFPVARLQATVVPAVCLLAVAIVSPFCALLLLAATPLVPLYGWLSGAGAAPLASAHADASRALAVRFHEALVGLPTLRGLGVVDDEADRLQAAARDEAQRAVAVLRLAFVATAVLELVATLSLALVAGYVGLSLLGYLHMDWVPGSVDLRRGLFALLVAPSYFAPLRAYAAAYHQRTEAVAAATTIDGVLGPSQILRGSRALSGAEPHKNLEIRAEQLTVDYPGRTASALCAVDLLVSPGRPVVVTGPSGAGKSTLLAALVGEVGATQQGRVLWNNTDVGDLGVGERRATFGWLRQQTIVFAGTVADNIALGREPEHGERDAAVADAARRAGLAVAAGALDLDVSHLSAGERQRIAIARLLLRDPAVLLLDEPTAHLDPEAEAALLPTLHQLCTGRTAVIATHSPQLLELADTVLRLDRGQSVAQAAESFGNPATASAAGSSNRAVARA